MNHLDSSSNPSSTTSSTPSSPAPFPTSSNPSSATTPPNPSPGQRDSRFNFPGTTPRGFVCLPDGVRCPFSARPSRLKVRRESGAVPSSSTLPYLYLMRAPG